MPPSMEPQLSQRSNVEVGRKLRQAQARTLLDQGGTGAVGAAIAAVFVAAGLHGEVDSATLWVWLGAVVGVQLARLVLSFAVDRKEAIEKAITDSGQRWQKLNIALIWASGLVWGGGLFVLWPASTTHQIIMPMVLAGLAAAGAIGYSPVRIASVPYAFATMVPLAGRFFIEGTTVHVIVGALALVYLGLILRVASTMRVTWTGAVVARFENQLLTLEAEAVSRELAEQKARLEELVRLDGLTQIPNRRYFDEAFEREWRRALRTSGSIAVLMADIDHFKNYNDSYGHLAGDDCLRMVAKTLSDSLQRATEVVARYGGEEFVVVLAEADLESARDSAEHLRAQIEALAIPHDSSETAGHVTISVGVAAIVPSQDLDPASLVHAADGALYEAKEAGRNRVHSAAAAS